MGWELYRSDSAACRCSAGIILVLTQEGLAVLEFQEKVRSRRAPSNAPMANVGATGTIRVTHWSVWGIESRPKIRIHRFRSTGDLLSGYKFLNDGERAAQAEGARRNFEARRGLSAFVFVAVHSDGDGAN